MQEYRAPLSDMRFVLRELADRDLLAQLPVHEGDTLSVESFQNVIRVVKGFDEHLSFAAMTTGSNEVTLRIAFW